MQYLCLIGVAGLPRHCVLVSLASENANFLVKEV